MKKHTHIIKSVIASFVLAITFFACKDNYKEIRQLNFSDENPQAEARGINLKYTDSGQIVSNLISEKLIDYSNKEFPYQEFLEGVEVHFWDKDKKTVVTADVAYRYTNMNLIDLRDNVVIITHDSLELYAEQLYWSQDREWLFTDKPYEIKFKDGSYNEGASFDSNQEFTNFLSRDNISSQNVDQKIK